MAEPELAKLKGIPILFVYGDHLNDVPANASIWTDSLARARQLVRQMKDFGLDATVLHLPDAGLSGNSHMFMMDKNNLRVADLVLDWIDTRVK